MVEVSSRCKLFATETSLHGFRYLGMGAIPMFHRYTRAIAISMGTKSLARSIGPIAYR